MPVLGGACRVLLSTHSCTYTLLQGCRQGKEIQEHNNHKLALTLCQKLGKEDIVASGANKKQCSGT